ncbi:MULTISPECIES: coenzyme F420-0:L-glutamate ligase [unclassified Flavonifractor]|uniref:coenzyme F420-0:L-glutamate ligase n=1 Tax=unclassified Flavonifractor TaxID=2629267 RepID=UPI000B3A4752|nr:MULTISPECIES: coenzyme F420-0:L-glutamate ligase [unclassified Flavonifractor]OUN10832.1 F420-0--gamma-glutamyl ligase [Flavonifractor sp. An9]OUN14552.1 F420-0--gamma-glutamyl ligase [Flavonifractor sp. An91]OUQ59721.1 F420-0--gamma-glutamyl ligase [Flavonifractor sp. An112]
MSRMVGTVSMGIRAPIIRSGDDLAEIVTGSVLEAVNDGAFSVRDRDVVAMTEAIVARAQGNYASVDDIAADVKAKLGGETIGVIFPILSRNRFAICLRGIAKGAKKVVLMLSYPSDEVGNHLIDEDVMDEKGVDPYKDVLSLERYRELFGYTTHPFTGVDYVDYYSNLIRESGAEVEVIFANDPRAILAYTKNVLACDIHTRARTKRRLVAAGAEKVFCLDEIMTAPINGSGYNENYGLLGSNKSTEDKVKLFPRPCQDLVEEIQARLLKATGKHVEVMVYGDGAFKDPVGKIWELADPVVSPAYTAGLEGTPNELKLKYLADNDFAALSGEALREAIKGEIKKKDGSLVGKMAAQGTTPRRLTDLIGSLCDLTSGSGDKGTPIVYIQGYFDNYTTE